MAGRYPDAWVDEVLARADIVDIVSPYVKLKRAGRNYTGLCPFHNEKTPSFSVNRESNVYHCFGCKAGGNVAQFVMEMEKLTFPEALRNIAKQLNIPEPVQTFDPREEQERSQRERMFDLNREAALFYHNNLYAPTGKHVLDYLHQRGIDDSMVRRFGLGASSDEWSTLRDFLQDKGYTAEEMAAAGLVHIKEGHSYDVYRGRAMFPIIDLYGRTVGFGGRAMGDTQPKYLNTQETKVFNKRLGVYGANFLRKQRDLKRLILVEGYMDVLALAQHGIQGAVATLGTALTAEQARLLKRLAPEVWVAYDGDEAGQMATMRALDILQKEMIPARVLRFPSGLDPDDLLRRDGREAFEAISPMGANHFRLLRLKNGYDTGSEEGNSAFSREACNLIAGVSSPVEREDLLRWLEAETGYPREVLAEQVRLTLPKKADGVGTDGRSAASFRRRSLHAAAPEDADEAEKTLLALLATGRLPQDMVRLDDFEATLTQGLGQALLNGKKPAQILSEAEDEAMRSLASEVFSRIGDTGIDLTMPAAEECLRTLRGKKVRQRIADISRDVDRLSGEDKRNALEEIMQLRQTLNSLMLSQREGKDVSG